MSTWPRNPQGDMLLPRLTAPIALVRTVGEQAAISLQDKFSFWQGEWFLDQAQGFPWPSIVGIKPPPVVLARQLVRQTVLAEPGVTAVDDIVPVFNRESRDMQMPAFRATINEGAIIMGGDTPFLVQAPPQAV